MRDVKTATWIVALLLSTSTLGCSVILPAHRNSYDLEGEKVTLRMIPRGGLCQIQNELNEGRASASRVTIGPEGDACPRLELEFAPALVAAPLAAAAVGFAVDLIKKELEKEAGRYEAQFEARIAQQNFWIRSSAQGSPAKFRLGYDGFEVIRETDDHRLTGSGPAFRMIFAFVGADDGSVFLVKPTYVSEKSAKAKVLSKLSVASWFNWFTKAVNQVQVKVDVGIDSIRVDEDKEAHFANVAAFPVILGSLDLENPKELTGPDLEGKDGGWFPGIRCSEPVPDEAGGCGTFWLKVVVTERDPSNAKKYLTQAAETVGEKKETIVKLVSGDDDGN